MKAINKTVAVLSKMENGHVRPLRLRLTDEEQVRHTYKISSILFTEKSTLDGDPVLTISCFLQVNNQEKICQLIYNLNTQIWKLYKI